MLAALAETLKLRKHVEDAALPRAKVLPFGLPSIDAALPEEGLPRGAVVEIASPRGLARATSLALAACASAQAEARLRGGEETAGAYCAWLDPGRALFAPAVLRASVDLERLLVIQPSMDELARIAVRVAASGVFSVIVIDTTSFGQKGQSRSLDSKTRSASGLLLKWVTSVRRLALAIEGRDTTVLLLTDALAERPLPLPVAMRLELDRPTDRRLLLRVAKDRRGRVANAVDISLDKKSA